MKENRQTAILNLISRFEIETQEDLAQKLREEGYKVTQATVSRDIKELKLTKAPGEEGIYKYVKPEQKSKALQTHQLLILARSVVSVTSAQNIVVLKTHAGMAQAAAAVLDAQGMEEIVGTLAGDDTIFCVATDTDSATLLSQRIETLLK